MPRHSCPSRVGCRLGGDDDDATKEEKRDTEKTRTPGGEKGEHFESLFPWCIGSAAFGYGDDHDKRDDNIALGMCVYNTMAGNPFEVT